jgi:hypothetical protein
MSGGSTKKCKSRVLRCFTLPFLYTQAPDGHVLASVGPEGHQKRRWGVEG